MIFPDRKHSKMEHHFQGFTIIELLIAITVLIALSAIAIQQFGSYRTSGDINLAVTQLRTISNQIQSHKVNNERFPASLSEIKPQVNMTDPWGRSYQYLNIEDADIKGKGQLRKDKNLVPINSDFDLYSMGADGKTVAPLTAKASQDDIVRANDGGYYGLASKY